MYHQVYSKLGEQNRRSCWGIEPRTHSTLFWHHVTKEIRQPQDGWSSLNYKILWKFRALFNDIIQIFFFYFSYSVSCFCLLIWGQSSYREQSHSSSGTGWKSACIWVELLGCSGRSYHVSYIIIALLLCWTQGWLLYVNECAHIV